MSVFKVRNRTHFVIVASIALQRLRNAIASKSLPIRTRWTSHRYDPRGDFIITKYRVVQSVIDLVKKSDLDALKMKKAF